jgi:two-component system cell cycle response regulator
MSTLAFEKDLPEVLTQADNLPSLPAVAMEVLRLTQEENSTIDDLAGCISRDPALAAKLLKLSNSSLFNMGQEITTLQRATMVLGMKTVKLMSLSFSLVGAIPREGSEAGFNFSEYWRRSLVSSVAARSMAKLVGSKLGDEAFLAGLLTHFGRLVMARTLEEDYQEVVDECGGWPSPDEEEKRLGFNNLDVCASLLKNWELPELIYMAVGYWNRSDELPEEAHPYALELVQLLEITALIERVLCDDQKGQPLADLHKRVSQNFGLQEGEIDSFLIGLESGISETAEMLSIQLPAGQSHEEIMNQAKIQIVNVSLGTVVDLKQARRDNESLEDEISQLETKANTDKLTGMPNRGAFDEFLGNQAQKRVRGKLPRALGLVMMDVDRFKNFNDTYGHQAGDEVLRMIGAVLNRMTRKGDLSARYGGEEFAVIAPHTKTFGIKTLAERLRKAVEEEVIEWEGQTLQVTASFGAACISEFESEEDVKKLIKLADHYLYKAKESGRNRCEVYPKVRFPGS